MKIGQRHEPDSRRTTPIVLMHWHASTKKTISDTPASGVISGDPSSCLASASDARSEGLSSSASAMPKTMPSVETKTSRARTRRGCRPRWPVEAERLDGRLDGAPDAAGHAVLERLARLPPFSSAIRSACASAAAPEAATSARAAS